MTEEQDLSVATLATCLMLQIATSSSGRDTMLCGDAATLLGPRIACHPPHYTQTSYLRNIHITISLLRQYTYRAHDPETYPERYANAHVMRTHTYLDLLRSTRPCPQAQIDARTVIDANGHTGIAAYTAAETEEELEKIENLSISDICVMPEDIDACLELSITAEAMGAKEIAEFLVRPGAVQYVDELPWEEVGSPCVYLRSDVCVCVCVCVRVRDDVLTPTPTLPIHT
jgi:hypothetical protein